MTGLRRGIGLRAFAVFGIALIGHACDGSSTDLPFETVGWPRGRSGSENGGTKGGPAYCPGPETSGRVLVDASHDGGVWWFPQGLPFDPRRGHQGLHLAETFRGMGFTVDELPSGAVVTDSILARYPVVIRAGVFGSYSKAELDAYEGYLSCDATLILLGEYLGAGEVDPVAEKIGLHFRGSFQGLVTEFMAHPITNGVTMVPYLAGSALQDFDPSVVTVLGRLDGFPVMGILSGHPAKVFFMGDTNSLEAVPQPLVANLVAWGF